MVVAGAPPALWLGSPPATPLDPPAVRGADAAGAGVSCGSVVVDPVERLPVEPLLVLLALRGGVISDGSTACRLRPMSSLATLPRSFAAVPHLAGRLARLLGISSLSLSISMGRPLESEGTGLADAARIWSIAERSVIDTSRWSSMSRLSLRIGAMTFSSAYRARLACPVWCSGTQP